MFSESAPLYDLIYGPLKDYAGECARIAALLRRVHPAARTVLDAACGTGEHARRLSEAHGYEVDGFDLEPEFVRLAGRKRPGGRFLRADLTDFDMGRRYDAVLCLFSSIAYVKTLARVRRTLRAFRRHLAPGGVVLVEPWFEPGAWQSGRVFVHTGGAEGITVCRMSHSSRRRRVSVVQFEYLVGRAGGIERLSETHELGLFRTDELAGCFPAAGLEVLEHDPAGLTGRGLFVARAREPA
jgi:SAM-dependent methyltransferase